ncbi:ABC transporter substrate-binding protein [Microtetraspora fusca]|uniref:ABC transporter substrate-binding protein n=1 Tax=Microtetraspora fusca TaxID=1997 RepID=A0ABW6VF78_MICFU
MSRPRRVAGTKRAVAGAAAVTAAAVLSACSGGTSTAAGEPGTATGAPKAGGDARLLITQAIFSLDPAAVQTGNYGAQGGYMQALYDVLFYADIATNTVTGQLGESIEPVDDTCKNWALVLKPGLKFTDGTPLDAEAVVFNWERIQDPETASPQAPKLAGVTASAKNDTTVDIRLKTANCAFDRIVANSLGYIASPTAIKASGKQYAEKPVGAGPFKLAQWNRTANELKLVKNENYLTPGEPHLDSVTFATAGNAATVIDSIVSGQVQLANNVSTPTAVDDAMAAGLGVTTLKPSGGAAYQFNEKKAPFGELCARQALAYALDPAAIDKALNQSQKVGGPTYGLMDPSSAFYDESLKFPSADPAKAAAAVKECEAKGNPLHFTITALPGTDQKLAEYVASRLNQVAGFEVKVEIITAADAYTKIFVNRDFQITSYPGGMKFHDPDPLFGDWLSSGGATNLTGYATKEMDDALVAARGSRDEKDRIAAYRKVQEIWTTDLPFWIWGKPISFFVHDAKLTGVEPVNGGLDILLTQKLAYTG